jgi:hypothetical protein
VQQVLLLPVLPVRPQGQQPVQVQPLEQVLKKLY